VLIIFLSVTGIDSISVILSGQDFFLSNFIAIV